MILMSKYKGKHGGKKGQQIRAWVSPPPFRAMPERKHFFQEGFPKADVKRDNDNNMGRFKSQGETLLFWWERSPWWWWGRRRRQIKLWDIGSKIKTYLDDEAEGEGKGDDDKEDGGEDEKVGAHLLILVIVVMIMIKMILTNPRSLFTHLTLLHLFLQRCISHPRPSWWSSLWTYYHCQPWSIKDHKRVRVSSVTPALFVCEKKKTRYIVEHLVFPVSGISSSTPSPQPEPISSIAKWNQENQDEKGPRLILWKVVN